VSIDQQSYYPYPRSSTPEGLRLALTALVDALNRRQRDEDAGDATDISALIADLEALEAELQALLASISNGDALTPQQLFELSLVTAVESVLGSISEGVQRSIRESELAAEATIQGLLKGRRNEIAIRVEQTARLTQFEAFVQQLTTFSAQLSAAQASLTEEITARTNGDSALASQVTTLSSTVNGNTAQLQIVAAAVDGVETRFGVSLNNNGQVTGLIQLDGTAAGTTFTVVANKFLVAQPGSTGGDPVPVFAIGNVGGTPKLALRGDMLIDGSITAQKINVSQLSAFTANLGTVTAGLIRNADDTLRFDLPNMRLYRTDGKFDIDLKNIKFRMVF
jgi:hypothetical protein